MAFEFVAQSSHHSNHQSTRAFILSNIFNQPWMFIAMWIGAISNAALSVTIPVLTGHAFNELVNNSGSPDILNNVLFIALAVVFLQLLRAALQFMRNFASEVFAQRMERDLRDELYASLLGKSMTFHDRQSVGEIMARVTNDVREVNLMMNPGVNLLVGSSMFILIPLLAAPLIYPEFVLVPLLFVITHSIIQLRFVLTLHPIAEKVRRSFGRMNARLAEVLEGLQVVKGAAQEKQEVAVFNGLVDEVRDHAIHQGEVEARYLSFLILGLSFVGALIHTTILYQAGKVDIGQVVALNLLMYQFTFPVFTSVFSLSRIASGYASASRILKIITTQTDLDHNPQGYAAQVNGEIVFKNVNFAYEDEKLVLRDVSFRVKPGQTVALVGQTGSGKTTLTKLVNRIYDVDSGQILIDGVDVRDWNLEALRSQISIVEQDVYMFSRSIAENIAFGDQNAPQEVITEAARKAQAHDFISTFPETYETVVGQRGVTLSGGQRQRLAIARAFLTDPPILILDDSTSAIDSATEDLIQRAIWTAAKGRTTLLITHRLSQIRWADHIIVLRQGQVVAQGNHDELMESSEAYRRIFSRYERGDLSHHPTINYQNQS